MEFTKKGQNAVGEHKTWGYIWCRNMTCNREGRGKDNPHVKEN